MIRVLSAGDEPALEAFLKRHASTSLFLRANVREGGLVDEGRRLQGTYAASFDGSEIVGVASHCWNGILLVQAPRDLAGVARAAVAASGRKLAGYLGPWDQVTRAREATGTAGLTARRESPEDLFELDLAQLRVPDAVTRGEIVVRAITGEDLDDFARLEAEYEIEALGRARDPEAFEEAREDAERHERDGDGFIARHGGRAVAACTFNAQLPDCVQIGGVYTPAELRGRGYARAVVGGAVAMARERGVRQSILFTDRDNERARRAYLALGYRIIGDYGIVLM